METLTAKAKIGIQKSKNEIFQAIIETEQMSQYFISKSSGNLEEGTEVVWQFPEFDGSFPVKVLAIIPNELIRFVWDPDSIVEIEINEISNQNSVVKVQEVGHKDQEKALDWALGQTEGWANFLACLKAWVEYKINLRKGAFEFLKS